MLAANATAGCLYTPFGAVLPISIGPTPTLRTLATSTATVFADVLISQDDVFTWYASLGKAGLRRRRMDSQAAR